MRMRFMRNTTAGFTLVELLITLAIVAVLASAAMPLTEVVAKRAREQELRSALRQIRTAIDTYKDLADRGRVARAADESGYPRTLDVLVDGVADEKDPEKRRIYILRRLPRNPMWTDANTRPAATWGLRSYNSSPQSPQPGRDVFDVYVDSGGVGLNGIAYREW
jgi:general secretion pathway protein G